MSGFVDPYKRAQELEDQVEQLEARLREVVALHQRCEADPTSDWPMNRMVHCSACDSMWPCDTIAAAQPEEPERVPEDSPDSVPKELEDFKARGYVRINRGPPQLEEK